MASLAEIMTSDFMPPVATPGFNISVWTQGKWEHYVVDWVEQQPYGAAYIRDFGALAANTLGNSTLVTQLQLDEAQMVQVRFRPLDDFEIRVWQTRSTGRFVTKNVHAIVDPFTAELDPLWKSTTVFVLGKERDLYMELRNVTDYALTMTRVHFWGYRFALTKLDKAPSMSVMINAEGRS